MWALDATDKAAEISDLSVSIPRFSHLTYLQFWIQTKREKVRRLTAYLFKPLQVRLQNELQRSSGRSEMDTPPTAKRTTNWASNEIKRRLDLHNKSACVHVAPVCTEPLSTQLQNGLIARFCKTGVSWSAESSSTSCCPWQQWRSAGWPRPGVKCLRHSMLKKKKKKKEGRLLISRSLTRKCAWLQSSQFAEPLWTDSGLKS